MNTELIILLLIVFAIAGYLCLKNSKQIDPSFAALSCFERHQGDVRSSNETNQLIDWLSPFWKPAQKILPKLFEIIGIPAHIDGGNATEIPVTPFMCLHTLDPEVSRYID